MQVNNILNLKIESPNFVPSLKAALMVHGYTFKYISGTKKEIQEVRKFFNDYVVSHLDECGKKSQRPVVAKMRLELNRLEGIEPIAQKIEITNQFLRTSPNAFNKSASLEKTLVKKESETPKQSAATQHTQSSLAKTQQVEQTPVKRVQAQEKPRSNSNPPLLQKERKSPETVTKSVAPPVKNVPVKKISPEGLSKNTQDAGQLYERTVASLALGKNSKNFLNQIFERLQQHGLTPDSKTDRKEMGEKLMKLIISNLKNCLDIAEVKLEGIQELSIQQKVSITGPIDNTQEIIECFKNDNLSNYFQAVAAIEEAKKRYPKFYA